VRIWLCQDKKRILKTDMDLPFMFSEFRTLINTTKIEFPESKISFHADHIDVEFYGLIQVSGTFVQAGNKVVINAGCLKVNLL